MIAPNSSFNNSYTEVTLVTPDMAKKLLSSVADFQRPISQKKVNEYATFMRRGEWQVTPTHSIGISEDGEIVDGQHRLAALVKFGQPVKMSIVFNCPKEIFGVIDQGYKRNLNQIAAMAGKRFSRTWNVAALNTLLWRHDRLTSLHSNTWSPDDCLYLLDKYEQALVVTFPKGYSGQNQNRMAGFRGAVLRANISCVDSQEEISDFVKVVATGLPLDDGRVFTMALMLRNNIFMNTRKTGGSTNESRFNIYVRTLIALDKYLNGKKMQHQVSFNRAELKRQPFPIKLDQKPKYQSVKAFFEMENKDLRVIKKS